MMNIQPINPGDPYFAKPWAILTLIWDVDNRNVFGLPNLIDAFEQIMQDPNEKKNLTSYMLEIFSDLNVLTKAINKIETYQP